MNQATSHWLHPRCLPLLLLLPLSLASAQSTPYRLEFYNPPSSLVAGGCGSVVVKLFDAQGNEVVPTTPVLVSLSSTHPDTGRFYEREGCSTAPVSSVYIGPSSYFRQLWFRDTLAGEVALSASAERVEGATRGSIRVAPAAFQQVLMRPSPSSSVPACTEVELQLTPADLYGNPVSGAYPVALCRQPGTSASFVGTNLSSSRTDSDCVHGQLSNAAAVTWLNQSREQVTFTLTPTGSQVSTLSASWSDPVLSGERSTLTFLGTSETTPALLVKAGPLRLQLALRDTCGNLTRPPEGKRLDFAGEAPLRVDSLTEESDGRWTASVSLPECPASGQEELSLWPTLDGEKLSISDGKWLERKVRPLCLGAELRLSLRPEQQALKGVEPGARMDFAVEVRNTGQAPLPAGRLKVSLVDLSGLELALGDQPLAQSGEYFVLPELDQGATLTLGSKVDAAFKSPLSVKAQVWYGTADGVKLAEQELTLEAKPQVDVGCGCHAGPLASHWLALLALASRARARSGRLRRSERIERQEPCRQ